MAKKRLIRLLVLLLPLTMVVYFIVSLIVSLIVFLITFLLILLSILVTSLVLLLSLLKSIKKIIKKIVLYFNSALIAFTKTEFFQLIERYKFHLLTIILIVSFYRFFEAFIKQLLLDKKTEIPAFLTSFDNNLVTKILFIGITVYMLIKGVLRVSKNEKIELKTFFTTAILGAVYVYFRMTYGHTSFAVFYTNDIFNIYYFDLLMLPLAGNLLLLVENAIIGILRFIRLVGVFIYLKSRRLLVRLRCAWRKAVKNFNGCTYIKRHLKMPILRCCVHIRRSYRKIHNIWKIVHNTWKKAKKRTTLINPSKGFLLETPIEDEKDDLFNRKNISPQMVERIYHSANPTTSFAVGIVSQWGNGKTSFLNLMCKELEKKGAIFFHFKPWVYEDKKSITYAFFSGLSQALHPYNKSLSRHLRLYSSMLSAVGTPFSRFCSALLMQGNDFEAQHTKIRNAIKNIGRPVIITIDDFDRLDEKEIAEVLKLIRNTASFPNTIYIAAYDRGYIAKALEKINGYSSSKYLEKIFQLEFDLPAYDKQPMLNWVYKELEPILTTEDQVILKEEIGFEENLLNNRRDAIRLVNQFSIAYKFLKGEIYFMDLLSIEYIHLKYPLVYDALSKDIRNQLKLKADEKDITSYCLFEESSLSENLAELTKSTSEKKRIEKLLKNLFRPPLIDKYQKRISSIYYIHRYFYYSLLDDDVSEIDFSAAWSGNEKTKERIVSIYKDKNIWKLIKRIEDKYKSGLKSDEEYKKLFDFLFLIYENPNYSNGKSRVEGIFTKAIDDYNKTNKKDKPELSSIIDEHKGSELALKLLSSIIDNINILDYFTEKDVLNKLEECLKTHFDKNPSMEKVGELMTYALNTNYENSPDKSILMMKFLRNETTKRLFIDYIEKNSDQLEMLLPYFIYSDDTNGSLLWNPAISIWEKEGKNKEENRTEKYNEFKQFIDKITKEKDTPILKEFKEFIQQCIGYKNKGSIFHFKYLKPYYPKEENS